MKLIALPEAIFNQMFAVLGEMPARMSREVMNNISANARMVEVNEEVEAEGDAE